MAGVQATLGRILGQVKRSITPPIYNENESFRSFCRRLNDYLNASEYTEDDAIRLLPSLLIGHSRDAFEQIDQQVRINGPWEQLLTELNQLINTEDRIITARLQLGTLRQGEKSVQTFATACRETVTKAYPADEAAREAVLLEKFLDGLNPNLRKAVYKAKPRSFRDAMEKALQEEAIDNLIHPDDIIANAVADLSVAINALQERAEESSLEENSESSDNDHYEDENQSERWTSDDHHRSPSSSESSDWTGYQSDSTEN